jgi:hypothetical protein
MTIETVLTNPPLILNAVTVIVVWTLLELYLFGVKPKAVREILLPAWIMATLLSVTMLTVVMIYGFYHSYDKRDAMTPNVES